MAWRSRSSSRDCGVEGVGALSGPRKKEVDGIGYQWCRSVKGHFAVNRGRCRVEEGR